MLSFVNATVSLLYGIYLMHSLHHTLLDCCKYLMMQSCVWRMVRTRATNDNVLNVPEGSVARGHGFE
jgi:hypothetical protein